MRSLLPLFKLLFMLLHHSQFIYFLSILQMQTHFSLHLDCFECSHESFHFTVASLCAHCVAFAQTSSKKY